MFRWLRGPAKIEFTLISREVDILNYVDYSRHMDLNKSLTVFDALSQETRLQAFRFLVKAGQSGLPAGELSERLEIPHNTLSFHLNHLSNANIIYSRREGRSIIYSANFSIIQDLIGFLVKDCCSEDFASIRQNKKKGCAIIELNDCCNQ